MSETTTLREPEFVDLDRLDAGWSIKRSLAYQLIAEEKIRSISLRRDGKARGKRLVDVESVRQFLKSCSGNVAPALSEHLRRARARRGKGGTE